MKLIIYSAAESPYPVVKYALHRLGVCGDSMASPLQTLLPAQKKKVDIALKKITDVLDWA